MSPLPGTRISDAVIGSDTHRDADKYAYRHTYKCIHRDAGSDADTY